MPALKSNVPPSSASRRALLLAGVGVAAFGCASTPAPPPVVVVVGPPTLVVTLVARDDINPDVRGRPSPLAVRVVELRSTSGFEAADFFSLYERDQAVLTTELLAREQFILKPGETQSYTRAAHADTRFIGVYAAYRDLEHSIWRATAALVLGPAIRQERVQIALGRAAVRIEVVPAN